MKPDDQRARIRMKTKELSNFLTIIGVGALLAACGSIGGGGATVNSGRRVTGDWKKVAGVSSVVTGKREVMRATVNGHEFVAVLIWRDYSGKQDDSVSRWYGDMALPPPKFVVESLTVSIDGKGMILSRPKVRYLASQEMSSLASLGLNRRGKQFRVLVDVGNGAESWTATYVIDSAGPTLVSHAVEEGFRVHNGITE